MTTDEQTVHRLTDALEFLHGEAIRLNRMSVARAIVRVLLVIEHDRAATTEAVPAACTREESKPAMRAYDRLQKLA